MADRSYEVAEGVDEESGAATIVVSVTLENGIAIDLDETLDDAEVLAKAILAKVAKARREGRR